MAAPTLQAEGATASGVTTGVPSIAIPTHQADDILLVSVVVWVPNTTTPDAAQIPTPSGWALIGAQIGQPSGSPRDGWSALFWRRATGAGHTVTLTRGAGWDTGNDTMYNGRAYVVRGCVTTGDPWDQATQNGPHTAANQSFPAVTVSGNERTVIQFGAVTDNLSFSMASSGWTTGTEDNDPGGTDSCFQTARKDNVSSSTSADAATVTAPAAGFYAFHGVSFKPPAAVDKTPSTDSGSGAETFSLNTTPSIETAAGVENAELATAVIDAGVGVEATSIALATTTDAGTGNDTADVTIPVEVADAAIGAEEVNDITVLAIDPAVGLESSLIAPALTEDTAQGAETSELALEAEETGTGGENTELDTSSADEGTGGEVIGLGLSIIDTVLGSDVLELEIYVGDAGVGLEDAGVVIEDNPAINLFLEDEAAGNDAASKQVQFINQAYPRGSRGGRIYTPPKKTDNVIRPQPARGLEIAQLEIQAFVSDPAEGVEKVAIERSYPQLEAFMDLLTRTL